MRNSIISAGKFQITESRISKTHSVWTVQGNGKVAYIHQFKDRRIYCNFRESQLSFKESVNILKSFIMNETYLWIAIKPKNLTLIHAVKRAGFKEQRILNRKKKSKYYLFEYRKAKA